MPKPKPAKPKPAKKPAAIKEMLSDLINLKKTKHAIDQQLALVNKAASELEEEILRRFSAEEISSVRVEGGLATRVVEVVPQVNDWDVFYAYVKKHDAFELLQRRIGVAAWRERLEAKELVPGVEPFNRVYLKLTLEK